MVVHRPARKQSAQTITRVALLGGLNLGGGDERLREAADVVAAGARDLAAVWSRKIPAAISVSVDGNVATVIASAPNARPAEFRLRHPLFGDRRHWYGPPGEKFLAPALDAKADDAMRKYAEKIDDLARKYGWDE